MDARVMKGGTISIHLVKEMKFTRLNINKDTKAAFVVETLLQRPKYQNISGEDYNLTLASSPFYIISPDDYVSDINTTEFSFRVTVIHVFVHLFNGIPNNGGIFKLDPMRTVKQTILCIVAQQPHILQSSSSEEENHSNTIEYDIYLITNAQAELVPTNGIKMESKRTLASYRLQTKDVLLLVEPGTANWNIEEHEIPIFISSEDLNLTKAFKYPLSTTFDHVLVKYLQKANVKQSKWFYGLYVRLDGGGYEEMQNHWKLADCSLPLPARLELRIKSRPATKWFGTDPSSLPMLIDPQNGIEVPEILVLLKDFLLIMDGFKTEGIFRLAGLESEMDRLKKKIESGEPFQSLNPHTIATLLKRWFKQLPTRILVGIDPELPDEEFLHLEKYLSRVYYNIYNWLVCVLLLVVNNEKDSKMNVNNCAIVWGPTLVGSAQDATLSIYSDSCVKGFEDTRLGINAIQHTLDHFFVHESLPTGIPREGAEQTEMCTELASAELKSKKEKAKSWRLLSRVRKQLSNERKEEKREEKRM